MAHKISDSMGMENKFGICVCVWRERERLKLNLVLIRSNVMS